MLQEHGRATELGELLKARRVALGMSQKRLSEELGVHANNVIEYEKGRRGMSLETLTKYCKALKLRVELIEED
ncbi:MAG: helix-turn-helix transcriptional regulator [Bacteroidales bacterium]|nr:helix-turn-helix transcriptional regulator [Bacteroidales bacterium]